MTITNIANFLTILNLHSIHHEVMTVKLDQLVSEELLKLVGVNRTC